MVPDSKLRFSLLDLLQKHRYITSFAKTDNRQIEVKLNPSSGLTVSSVKIFSTPGRHLYSKTATLPWGQIPNSLVIISTSLGLMSQRQAASKKVGGELVAEIF